MNSTNAHTPFSHFLIKLLHKLAILVVGANRVRACVILETLAAGQKKVSHYPCSNQNWKLACGSYRLSDRHCKPMSISGMARGMMMLVAEDSLTMIFMTALTTTEAFRSIATHEIVLNFSLKVGPFSNRTSIQRILVCPYNSIQMLLICLGK